MTAYFIRRLLFIPPTLIGMTLAVFFIIRFTPGGPMEQALLEARMKADGQKGGAAQQASGGLTPGQLLKLQEQYGHDKPFHVAYAAWLGLIPKETNRSREDFVEGAKETEVRLPGTAQLVKVRRDEKNQAALLPIDGVDLSSWRGRIITPEDQKLAWEQSNPGQVLEKAQPYVAMIYQPKFAGVLQGNLGESTRYSEPVWTMMKRRFPISLFYGLSSLIITYLVCIPLGVVKAIKHRTALDTGTSIAIFFGYAIPGFVLGVVLMVFLAARLRWFPLEGFVSPNFAELDFGGKLFDLLHHAVLPLTCYLVGSFASLTMLVKNNLLDQLASDYVRTAVAKGLPFRQAVTRHALRNSLIPVAATIGQALTILVAGSFLIERIFDIDGFGLMGFNALLEKDYPIVMATVTVGGLLLMLGNVLSDMITARLDPRIRFQ
jgi:microcin C transport system permease protein